jgi:hypothetical protein
VTDGVSPGPHSASHWQSAASVHENNLAFAAWLGVKKLAVSLPATMLNADQFAQIHDKAVFARVPIGRQLGEQL